MNIACFTVAAMDTFPQAGTAHAGGNALNQAIRFRHLGHRTAFAGALGTDGAGDRIAALLDREGVDTACLHRLPGNTACNQIRNDGSGERFGVDGAWQGGVYTGFRLGESDWAHLAGFDAWCTHADCPDFAETLRRKQPTQKLAVDFLHLLDPERLAACAGKADICYIGGTPDMADTLAEIAKTRPGVLVLTLGALGSIAFEGNTRYTQPALPLAEVVDTTGCGDAFQAAFSACRFTGGSLKEALLAGAENGRLAARSRGGVPWHTPVPSLVYGTKNAAKVIYMKETLNGLPLTLLDLCDPDCAITDALEDGDMPMENAERKAMHYFRQLQRPVFSIDSGLFFRGVPPEEQPGVHVRRRSGHRMDDTEMIAHYAALAARNGGRLEAWYHNAICLVLDEWHVIRYDGDDLNSAAFWLVDKPHPRRHPGFPIDSLSVDKRTGQYYYDMPARQPAEEKSGDGLADLALINGFHRFFSRMLPLIRQFA